MTKKKTKQTRKNYAKEFKLESLKLAEQIGVARAAADLGVGESLLYRWRKAAQTEGGDAFRGNGRFQDARVTARRPIFRSRGSASLSEIPPQPARVTGPKFNH